MNMPYLSRSKAYAQSLWTTDLGLDLFLMLSNCKKAWTHIFFNAAAYSDENSDDTDLFSQTLWNF